MEEKKFLDKSGLKHFWERLKAKFADKQDALTNEQTAAINSGITADKVNVYNNYASEILGKQDILESGVNIKTVNNESLLGGGNVDITCDCKPIPDDEMENFIDNLDMTF